MPWKQIYVYVNYVYIIIDWGIRAPHYRQLASMSKPGSALTFTYDADGNMTDDGSFLYAYDAENRLASEALSIWSNSKDTPLKAAIQYRRRLFRQTSRIASRPIENS